ncbi:adhesion G-protein coupled receptor G6-like isoform X2 [Thrips palmi]|uniref:Adhesion G-protein coupled receptor G6-like isoform X2 n=1 Tax=Thrips palmi TaxID=161013 RepID=A0A6P8XYL0_THRPL|nr:adhesion G-protein coupled receptor G6-like isoform X2 [Thrips palmi]
MAAAERGAYLGCLFLVFIHAVNSFGYHGRPIRINSTATSSGTSTETDVYYPYASCGNVPWGDGDGHGAGVNKFPVREFCCPEAELTDYGPVDWPMTRVNQWVVQACPYGASPDTPGADFGVPKASRRCAFSRSMGPVWRQSDYSQCRTKGASERDAAEAASNAENMTSDPSKIDSAAFQEATDLIFAAHQLAKTNRTVARSMLKALSNLVATSPSVQEASDANGTQRLELFRLMEEHGRGVRLSDDEYPYEHRMPNLHLAVYKLDILPDGRPDLPQDMQFRVNYDGQDGDVSVTMSPEAIQQAVTAASSTRQQGLRVRFMAVRKAELLVPPGALSGSQQVVTAALSRGPQVDETEDQELDLPVSGLQQPVRITMPLGANSIGTTHVCAYFDDNDGVWRTDGVQSSLDGMTVVCEATHLTPFTLLLDPYPRSDLADMAVPLTILGSIGSTLSVLGLALTILTYRFFSRVSAAKVSIKRAAPARSSLQCPHNGFSQDRWGRVLVQLCLSLLLLHLAYLASNLKGSLPPPGCVAVAVLVHVSLLASFSWMFIEGLLLYQILVTVFKTADTKFILKRLVFGWGVPILFVAVNGAVRPNYYLDTHPDYCVVSGANELQHMLATIAPCGLVMLANLAIFVRVCVVLLRQRQLPGVRQDADDRPKVSWAQVRGVIGVAFLLGVTWPLSPLAARDTTMGVVSTVLNAFQGVAIFVSRVLTHPEARRCWLQRFFSSTPDFGSSASYSLNEKGSQWFCLRWISSKQDIASVPKDRRSIFNGARPWSRGDSSTNISSSSSSSSSGVILSKSTSDTDILY